MEVGKERHINCADPKELRDTRQGLREIICPARKGGFFHDGRFATLREVVGHYNSFFGLGLTEQEANELVEYLESL